MEIYTWIKEMCDIELGKQFVVLLALVMVDTGNGSCIDDFKRTVKNGRGTKRTVGDWKLERNLKWETLKHNNVKLQHKIGDFVTGALFPWVLCLGVLPIQNICKQDLFNLKV